MRGFHTKSFPELVVEHLKPRNAAFGHPLRGKWQLGLRDYALGNHPLFELAKCSLRCLEKPLLTGSLARLGGYAWAGLERRPRLPSKETLAYIRREQLKRLSLFGQ
jgi:hypothetical protein